MQTRRVLRKVGAALGVVGLVATGFATFGGWTAGAGAAAVGFQNPSNGATLASKAPGEPCNNLTQGAGAPKVIKTALPGSTFSPGGTIHYEISFPAGGTPTATYALRDCVWIADSHGNFLSQLYPDPPTSGGSEGEFDNVGPAATFTYDYVIPPDVAAKNSDYVPGNQICNYAKTVEPTNAGTQDRKTTSACIAIPTPPALTVQKLADAGSVVQPADVGFTITAGNSGQTDATGYTLTDTLPTNSGLSWSVDAGPTSPAPGPLSGSVTVNCAINGGVLTCTPTGGILPAGSSFTLHIKSATSAATVTDTKCKATAGLVCNTASVQAGNATTATSTDQEAVGNAVAPSLTLAKAADAPSVTEPASVGFTITAANTTATAATGYSLTDNLPATAGLNWGPAAPTVTSPAAAPAPAGAVTVTCGIAGAGGSQVLTCTPTGGTFPGNSSFSVHVSSATTAATPTDNTAGCGAGIVCNTVNATSTNGNSPTANASTTVLAATTPGLSVTKDADSTPVTTPAGVGYTITVSNPGTATATTVVMNDPLPTNPGLTWSVDSVTPGGGLGAAPSCNIAAGAILTCPSAGTLSLAKGQFFEVHVISRSTACNTGNITNTASGSADGGLSSNSGAVGITVNQNAACNPAPPPPATGGTSSPSAVGQIGLTKTGPAMAHVGDPVTYSFSATNSGTVGLTNVILTDPVCDAAPVLVSRTGGNQDSTLDPGEVWNFTCTHVITAADPNPLPNTATVGAIDPSANKVSASASHQVTIIHPSISIAKSASPTSGTPGTPVTYTYVVTNTGDASLAPVVVTDDKLGTIGTIPSLDPGQSATLTRASTIGNAAVTNVGTATGTDPLGDPVSGTATATTTAVLGTVVTPPVTTTAPPKATVVAQLPFTGAPAGLHYLFISGVGMVLTGGFLLIGLRSNGRRDEED